MRPVRWRRECSLIASLIMGQQFLPLYARIEVTGCPFVTGGYVRYGGTRPLAFVTEDATASAITGVEEKPQGCLGQQQPLR